MLGFMLEVGLSEALLERPNELFWKKNEAAESCWRVGAAVWTDLVGAIASVASWQPGVGEIRLLLDKI